MSFWTYLLGYMFLILMCVCVVPVEPEEGVTSPELVMGSRDPLAGGASILVPREQQALVAAEPSFQPLLCSFSLG